MRKPTFLLMSALLAGCTARIPDKAVGPSGAERAWASLMWYTPTRAAG